MNTEFQKAYSFLFDETYQMWKSDLKKIFRIGTRGKNEGCNLSSCILFLIGIEFFSKKKKDSDAFADFIDTFYRSYYHGKMKKDL